MEIHWYLIAQDGTHPWNPDGVRVTDNSYMRQLAGAIDHCGFAGALIATGPGTTDPWTLATMLSTTTKTMKFIVAQYAGVISPLWLAMMTASVDDISGGRLIINVITGTDFGNASFGIYGDHEERYELADEYWGAFKQLMQGETVTFDGKYVHLREAKLLLHSYQKPYPELMFGGSSPAALEFAAKHCDTWLGLALPPEAQARKVQEVRNVAARYGRSLRCGLRLNVIVRETEKEAWQAAQWLYDHMDREAIARRVVNMQRVVNASTTEMFEAIGLDSIDPDNLPNDARAFETYPGFWSGISLIRRGPGTTLVGDPDGIVKLLREYEDVGIETMILGSYPCLEEAYRFSDLVMPLLNKTPVEHTARIAGVMS